jgi:ABC-2 type transport system permease protein
MTTFEGVRLTARRELVERTRERSFLVSTVIAVAILCAIIVVPRLLGAGRAPSFDVGLVGAASQPLGQALAAQAPAAGIKVKLERPADAAAAEAAVRKGSLDLAVVDGDQLLVKSELDDRLGVLVQAASRELRAQQSLVRAGLSPSQARAALAPPPLPVRALQPVDRTTRSKRSIATIAVFLLYGQLIGYSFGVASGVVEEKATRVVEVLLAAVRPTQLLAGKIIGVVGLVVATAVKAISLPAAALGTIASVLLWFLLGYAFYSSLFAVAGAIVSRQEELQNTAAPLNLLLVGSFLLAFNVALGNPGSTLAVVASFLPPVAPMILPIRMAAGEATAWQIALSLAIMLASIVAVVLAAGRLYAGAVLRTGARVKLREAWGGARRQAAARAG